MKKIILFAFAIATVVSCSKNEVTDINQNDPNKINFATYIDANTKASGVVTTQSIDEFGVYASSKEGNLSSQYIPNERVYRDGDKWNSNTSYYWPSDLSKTLYFYGYSPFYGNDSEQYSNFTASQAVITDYPQIETLASDQQDIVVAQASRAVADAKANNEAVNLNFEHLLSLINVQINFNCNKEWLKDDYVYGSTAQDESDKYDDENDDRITLYYDLSSVELVNLIGAHNGLDLVNKCFLIDGSKDPVNYKHSDLSVLKSCQANSTHSGDQTILEGDFMLLPQRLRPQISDLDGILKFGAAIKIDFALEQFGHFIVGSYKGDGKYDNTKSSSTATSYSMNDIGLVTAYLPIQTSECSYWKQGKAYRYVIDIDFDNSSIYVGYDESGKLILDEDDKLTLSVSTEPWIKNDYIIVEY